MIIVTLEGDRSSSLSCSYSNLIAHRLF